MKKKTYMAPEVKTFMLEPLQVIAASDPKIQIVEDEEYNPTQTFSIHQTWSSSSDLEDED